MRLANRYPDEQTMPKRNITNGKLALSIQETFTIAPEKLNEGFYVGWIGSNTEFHTSGPLVGGYPGPAFKDFGISNSGYTDKKDIPLFIFSISHAELATSQ